MATVTTQERVVLRMSPHVGVGQTDAVRLALSASSGASRCREPSASSKTALCSNALAGPHPHGQIHRLAIASLLPRNAGVNRSRRTRGGDGGDTHLV